jgi:hypothetical protein
MSEQGDLAIAEGRGEDAIAILVENVHIHTAGE